MPFVTRCPDCLSTFRVVEDQLRVADGWVRCGRCGTMFSALQARVVDRTFRGSDFLYTLALDDGTRLLSLVPSHHDHAIGQRIGIRLDLEHVVVFAADKA